MPFRQGNIQVVGGRQGSRQRANTLSGVGLVVTEKKSHRTEITIAVITLVGVLGAALFGNWDKVFAPDPPPAADGTEESDEHTESDGSGETGTVAVPVDLDMTIFEKGSFLSQSQLDRFGVLTVQAVPQAGYCSSAQPAILAPGSYRFSRSVLSTAADNQLNRCNSVPLGMKFTHKARLVRLTFYGANVPYVLTAYDDAGRQIGTAQASARPYDYSAPSQIQIVSDSANIKRITFGHSTALTQIATIQTEL